MPPYHLFIWLTINNTSNHLYPMHNPHPPLTELSWVFLGFHNKQMIPMFLFLSLRYLVVNLLVLDQFLLLVPLVFLVLLLVLEICLTVAKIGRNDDRMFANETGKTFPPCSQWSLAKQIVPVKETPKCLWFHHQPWQLKCTT